MKPSLSYVDYTLVEVIQGLVARGMPISEIAQISTLSEKECRRVARKGEKLPLNRQTVAMKPLKKLWIKLQGTPA